MKVDLGMLRKNAEARAKDGELFTATLIHAAADEIEALRKGVEAIANGDVPRPIGKRYRSDLEPSKHDRCVHDKWMYEDCGNCIEAFAYTLLKGASDNG